MYSPTKNWHTDSGESAAKLMSKEEEENAENEGEEEVKSTAKGITAAVWYGIMSTSMAFIDKALLNTFKFNNPCFIMTCQMLFTIFVLEILRVGKFIVLQPYTFKRGQNFIIPSTCYWINAVLSMVALGGMNIPMFGVVRRCEPLALLILGSVMLNKRPPSCLIITSVLLITGGCIIAGYGDVTFSFYAYLCGIVSIFTQALYLTIVEKVTQGEMMSTTETLQLNSFNTLPFLLFFAVFNDEFSEIAQYRDYSNAAFIMTFLAVISCGCLLNYTMFLCTSMNSALTTSVTGAIKSVVQTILGLYTFGGVHVGRAMGWGMGVNIVGGLLYIYAKYKEKVQSFNDKALAMPVISLGTRVTRVENNMQDSEKL